MIGLRLTVPFACWRKGHAREFLETEVLPPPATCYGALLALVGERDRERHRGCRVTAGLVGDPEQATILRALWQIKNAKKPQGVAENAGPDFQQLLVNAELVIWCDSDEEEESATGLEARIRQAFASPGEVERFGGWSLGESTHLINDAWLLGEGPLLTSCRAFLLAPDGTVTLPVWVDHIGALDTRYAVGRLETITNAPHRERIPRIPLATGDVPRGQTGRKEKQRLPERGSTNHGP